MLSAAKDGEDGKGLELEEFWAVFSNLETLSSQSCQKLNMNSAFYDKCISYLITKLSGMLYVRGKPLNRPYHGFRRHLDG